MEDIIKSKVCSECGIEKNLDCFNIRKDRKSGLRSQCKDCDKKRNKQDRENNKQNYISNKFNLTSKICGTCKIEKI